MNECMNEWMNKWIIKWIPEKLEMNKWMSGWNNISECVSAHRWHKMGGYSFLVSLVEGKKMAKVCRKWSKAFHIEKPYTFKDFRKLLQRSFFQLTLYTIFRMKMLGLRIRSRIRSLRVPTNFRQSREAIIISDEGFHVGVSIPKEWIDYIPTMGTHGFLHFLGVICYNSYKYLIHFGG